MVDEMALTWANGIKVNYRTPVCKIFQKVYDELSPPLQKLTVIHWGFNENVNEKAKMLGVSVEQYLDYVAKLRRVLDRKLKCKL